MRVRVGGLGEVCAPLQTSSEGSLVVGGELHEPMVLIRRLVIMLGDVEARGHDASVSPSHGHGQCWANWNPEGSEELLDRVDVVILPPHTEATHRGVLVGVQGLGVD
jgi:hypothetical protein